jgi:hypothetical protein
MPKIIIEIELGNAAFEENPQELTQIIYNDIAVRLGNRPYAIKPGDEGKLRDSNGNTVGSFRVVP